MHAPRRCRGPGRLCTDRSRDDGVDLARGGHRDRSGGHRHVPLQETAGPGARDSDGRVGVRGVGEALAHHGLRTRRTPGCGRRHVPVPEGDAEGLLLGVHRGVLREQRVQEVLARGVLLQATDQVGDGDVEVVACDDRGVEEHRADLVAHRPRLRGCHALEHLDVERLADATALREQVGRGDVEQVVAGDADPHRGRPGRVQGPVDQSQVRRVDLGLGAVGGLRPPVQLRLDLLHGQVGALDQAHLQAGTTGGAPCGRDVRQLVEGVGGVRQVGLQHDAGLGVQELRVGHEALEDAHREGEVAVLLHVEVEEGAVPGRGRVQRTQPVDHALDAAVGVPRGQLAGHRRDLDRHVVHVGPLDQGRHPRQPGGRLALPQHGLAEQVQVEAEAVGSRGRQVRGQAGAVVGDEVADEAAQTLPGGRHDDAGQRGRDEGTDPEHRPVERAEEARRGARRQSGELSCRHPHVLRASHPVHEPHRELEPCGIRDQRRQAPRRASLPGRLALRRRREPGPGQPDRVLDDVVSRRHAAPSSAGRPGRGRTSLCSSALGARRCSSAMSRPGPSLAVKGLPCDVRRPDAG